MLSYRIVVPIFNEEDSLGKVLEETLEAGYLDRVTFVNDASTDNSRAILERWQESHGIDVLHLDTNRKKEGAIREVLEGLETRGELPPFVCLLDADSVIQTDGQLVDDLIETASGVMRHNGYAGLALRIEARLDIDSSILQRCVYVDYAAVEADNWITSHQSQLWVINGPGGLFRAKDLLHALRQLTPDFETGDLQISVNLMKRGCRIGYYPSITVLTAAPSTLREYFQQRRRWERGTMKVLWRDRSFYWNLFPDARFLAVLLLIYLSLYPGILMLALALPVLPDSLSLVTGNLILVSILWYSINVVKVIANPYVRRGGHVSVVPVWAIWNGLLWFSVTWVARVVGFVDATLYLQRNRSSESQEPLPRF